MSPRPTNSAGTRRRLAKIGASIVKYFPLAVRDACANHNITLKIKRPSGTLINITDPEIAPADVIGVKPNESIFLLGRFVSKIAKEKGWSIEDASKQAWDLLNESPYSPANGMGAAVQEFPPTLFVSGAAHYSITKAADLLGIGRKALWMRRRQWGLKRNRRSVS